MGGGAGWRSEGEGRIIFRRKEKTCAKKAALRPTGSVTRPDRICPTTDSDSLSLSPPPSVPPPVLPTPRISPPSLRMALQSLKALSAQKLEPPLAEKFLKETRAALIQKPSSSAEHDEKYVPNTHPTPPLPKNPL